MNDNSLYGYLLVHFVEDPTGHTEKVYFSLSLGDDPLRWRRLYDGEPVLWSEQGTTGVRDPHIVRGLDGGFHVVATDLRVWRPEGPDWQEYTRRGSRDLVIWDSPDLISWSEPRFVTVAPPGAGMAWAPETVLDPESGELVVHFASATYDDDPGRTGPAVARLWTTRTRDMRTFTPAEPYLELPGGVIDMTVAVAPGGRVHRFAKQDDTHPGSWCVFHQAGSGLFADDFQTLATRIGQNFAANVEGPLIFPANDGSRWFLWVDQYSRMPMGYNALTTTDLDSGRWEPVPDEHFHLPENTKHGAVLPLTRDEWERLDHLG